MSGYLFTYVVRDKKQTYEELKNILFYVMFNWKLQNALIIIIILEENKSKSLLDAIYIVVQIL